MHAFCAQKAGLLHVIGDDNYERVVYCRGHALQKNGGVPGKRRRTGPAERYGGDAGGAGGAKHAWLT